MASDAKGWVLGAMIDHHQYRQLWQEAQRALERFGTVLFDMSAHIVAATKA